MQGATAKEPDPAPESQKGQPVFAVLFAISFSHLLNDTIQALIPSLDPVFKESQGLTFTQLGLITLTFQCTASLLQPMIGWATDRRSLPFSLAAGMGLTLVGLLLLSQAHTFHFIVISAGLVGMGSAIFHPEASRLPETGLRAEGRWLRMASLPPRSGNGALRGGLLMALGATPSTFAISGLR